MRGGSGQQPQGDMYGMRQVYSREDITSSVGDIELSTDPDHPLIRTLEKSTPHSFSDDKTIVQILKAAALKSFAAMPSPEEDEDAAILEIEQGRRLGDNGEWVMCPCLSF